MLLSYFILLVSPPPWSDNLIPDHSDSKPPTPSPSPVRHMASFEPDWTLPPSPRTREIEGLETVLPFGASQRIEYKLQSDSRLK